MTFAEEVETDTPTLSWDTREASGTLQPDASGNGNTGTVTGSPVSSADGLTFDGSGQWIASANVAPAAYAAFCLEAVVSPDVLTSYFGSIFGVYAPTLAGDFNIFCQDSSGDLVYGGDAVDDDDFLFAPPSGGDPVAAGLQHLLLDFDGTTLTLYLDGIVYGTAGPAVSTINIPEAAPFFLGDDYQGGDGYLGLIRHGIFYSHALGATRAAAHATAALTDDPPPVRNLYTPPTLNDCGPVLFDTQGLPRALFRHYAARPRFQTVWKLATEPVTYSLTQPYPLITPEDVRQGNTPIGQQYNAATYLHVYYGPETVDADEAARLVASGIGTVT